MGLFDFFRRSKVISSNVKPGEPNWKAPLTEDPYDSKIQSAMKLKNTGREEEAEIILRQIVEEKKEHVRAWYALADLFIETNAVGRALYCYERILEFQPFNGKALDQSHKLSDIVMSRPDYLWEYNKEKGII